MVNETNDRYLSYGFSGVSIVRRCLRFRQLFHAGSLCEICVTSMGELWLTPPDDFPSAIVRYLGIVLT